MGLEPGLDQFHPQRPGLLRPVARAELFVEKATEEKRFEGPSGEPGHDVLLPPEPSRFLVVLPRAFSIAQEGFV